MTGLKEKSVRIRTTTATSKRQLYKGKVLSQSKIKAWITTKDNKAQRIPKTSPPGI